MKINPAAALSAYKAAERNAAPHHSAEQVRQGEAAARGENTDQIHISARGARQADIEQATRSILSEIQEPASPDRLESLRLAVQDGTYHVATGALVDAVMTRWFGA